MALVRSSGTSRALARLLVATVALVALVLVVTPWQQTAPGSGRVVAYAPEERRQNVEAPVDGRVHRWYVREGSVVKKGDPVVDLSDNDPDLLPRLRAQRDAVATRLEAARARARSMGSRVDALGESRANAVSAAEARVRMARQRVVASEQAVALATATLYTARLNVDRQNTLADKGLASQRKLELTELEVTQAGTDLERAEMALAAARSEEQALTSDRGKVNTDAKASIEDANASQGSADAEVASATAELARAEVQLARQGAQRVFAPRDGSVFRVVANGQAGEMVKAGDILAVLVPDTGDRAVELWISGNDMPLVREGTGARVQFEGWPALQFSGWPSVAIGTFAGRVAFVDATDNGAGLFRLVVVPEDGAPWPAPRYLRQGVRAQAWMQLGRVRLGYELWRQLNAFPPSLPKEPGEAGRKGRPDGKAVGE